MRSLLIALVSMAAVGCSGAEFGPPQVSLSGSCGGGDQGVLVLGWTIRGSAPSAQSCGGIKDLSVSLDNGTCAVEIAPVPCALDHWRYDHLPEGVTTVVVSARDSAGRTVASGSADVDITPVAPSPAPVDLE